MKEYKGYPAPWKYETWNTRKNKLIGVSIPIGVRDLDIKLPLTHVREDECPNAKCCNTKEHATALLISKAPDMLEMLQEAKIQIEYLQGKFGETGSGNNVLSRIETLINQATTL